LVDRGVTGHLSSLPMLIDFGPGSRQLFTATVNQKVTYGLATTHPEPREICNQRELLAVLV